MPLKSPIQFHPSLAAIEDAVTKFGGQPVWQEGPQWPLSRTTGNPMRFICQVAIDEQLFPGATGKMAYVFMTDEEEYVDGTWEPDGGENAVIVQPGSLAPGIRVAAHVTGPTLYDMVEVPAKDELEPLSREYAAAMRLAEEPAFASAEVRSVWTDEQNATYAASLQGNKVGGAPLFLQYDEFPDGDDWRLLLQLDSADVPFSVNFGDAGVAYAFIDAAGQTGKMLWQCG